MNTLVVKQLNKTFEGAVSYHVLKGIDLTVQKGEFVGIMGPSGSGKTTFLNLISTIDKPTGGEVWIGNKNPHTLKRNDLALFRRRELGFVFQNFNLLDTLTVKENIILPLTLDGVKVEEMNNRAEFIAEKLGIHHILNKRTYEISGGQAQRTAIARAIIHNPKLILADEPTGNLDSKSSTDVLTTLQKINQTEQTTLLMVTHDALAASYCNRVIFIKDGLLYNQIEKSGSQNAFFNEIIEQLSLIGGQENDIPSVSV